MSRKKIIGLATTALVAATVVLTLWLLPDSARHTLLSLLDASSAQAAASPTASNPYKLIGSDAIEATDEALKTADIRTAQVSTADIPVTLTLTGKTAFNLDKASHVRAQFGGKVMDVRVKLGDKVLGPGEPGGPTILCIIESNDLAQDKAAYVQAKIQLGIDTDTRDRLKELVKDGVVNEKQYIDAESAVTKDQAAMEASRQQLLIFGLKQDEIDAVEKEVGKQRMDYIVTAPRTGVIAEKGVSGGEIADPSVNLFTIADTKSLWVVGDVYERDLRLIALGQPIKAFFASEPTRGRECTIDWISPALDPNTHCVHIQGVLDNTDGHLLADMYATLSVTIAEGKNSIVIPAGSVVRQDMDAFAFLETGHENGRTKFQRTPIKVEALGAGFGTSDSAAVAETVERNLKGSPSQGLVRIVSGMKPGDTVVTSGALGLHTEMIEQASGQ